MGINDATQYVGYGTVHSIIPAAIIPQRPDRLPVSPHHLQAVTAELAFCSEAELTRVLRATHPYPALSLYFRG
jgi:hypothetical protein